MRINKKNPRDPIKGLEDYQLYMYWVWKDSKPKSDGSDTLSDPYALQLNRFIFRLDI